MPGQPQGNVKDVANKQDGMTTLAKPLQRDLASEFDNEIRQWLKGLE